MNEERIQGLLTPISLLIRHNLHKHYIIATLHSNTQSNKSLSVRAMMHLFHLNLCTSTLHIVQGVP